MVKQQLFLFICLCAYSNIIFFLVWNALSVYETNEARARALFLRDPPRENALSSTFTTRVRSPTRAAL